MEKGFSRGFTLTEVIMTVAVAAILVTIGVPSYKTMILNSRKNAAISDLQATLSLARNSAISQRQDTTVCKSNDNSSCTTNGDWSQGWIAFLDPDHDGDRTGTEELLRAHGPIKGDATYDAPAASPVENRVTFKPKGLVSGTFGTITYTDSRGDNYAGKLIISFGGQVRYEDNSAN